MDGFDDGDRHGALTFRHDDQHHAQRGPRRLAEGLRRMEIISGEPQRRYWAPEEKARITALSLEPGVNVSEVARRNDVSIGLLHQWRRQARASMGSDEGVRFVPVVTGSERSGSGASSGVGQIELELNGVRIRVTGPVAQATLVSVLSAVRTAT